MKNFIELSLDDVIYRLCDTYELGNPEKSQVHKIIINDMAIDKGDGSLCINQTRPSWGDNYYSLIIEKSELQKTSYQFKPTINTHRAGLYFTNPDEANNIVRDAVLAKINSLEQSIPQYIKSKTEEIANLRQIFHPLLNPSYYSDFKITDNLKPKP